MSWFRRRLPKQWRSASVDRLGARTLVLTADQSGGISYERLSSLLESAAPKEVAIAVLDALDQNRFDIEPTDDERSAREREILEAAGVRSWGQLERQARAVAISQRGDLFEITPLRREPRGGFTGARQEKLSLTAPELGELAEAIEGALRDPDE